VACRYLFYFAGVQVGISAYAELLQSAPPEMREGSMLEVGVRLLVPLC
jgi:hypothetical protein